MIWAWSVVAALCLAWLAGDAVLGLLVAPRLFHHATAEGVGAAFAGLVFGDVLHRWVTFAGLLCVVPAASLLGAMAGMIGKRHGWRRAILPITAAALLVLAHVFTATVVDAGKRRAAELRREPDEAALADFRTDFHARSRLAFGAEMLLAFIVAAGCTVAVVRWRPATG